MEIPIARPSYGPISYSSKKLSLIVHSERTTKSDFLEPGQYLCKASPFICFTLGYAMEAVLTILLSRLPF